MAQQFNPQGMNTQNIKKRYAVLVFIKSSTAPLVLYVKDAQALYQELIEKMQSPNAVLIEKETGLKIDFQRSKNTLRGHGV